MTIGCNRGAGNDDAAMSKSKVHVGSAVPDFEIPVYDPKTGDFGTYSLAQAKADGRWTILFFYPADFTFV